MTTPDNRRPRRGRFWAWFILIVCVIVALAITTAFALFGSPNPIVTQMGILVGVLCGAGIAFSLIEIRREDW